MPGKILPRHFSPAANAKKFFGKSISNVASSLKSTPSSTSIIDSSLVGTDAEAMDLLKRHKKSLGHSHKDKSGKGKSTDDQLKSVVLDIAVESPPLVSYGPPEDSSGALFSGQFKVVVVDKSSIEVDTIQVRLLSTTTIKKPAVSNCAECSGGTKELKKWNFMKDLSKMTLTPGEHKFPLSFLFAGDLPATTHCHMALLDYHFETIIKTTSGTVVENGRVIELQRAIRPGNERTSIRVFPPTNMTATIRHIPVCYTNSDIPVSLLLSGINGIGKRADFRWRIRRLLWRVEEYQKILSPCCERHASKCPEGQPGIKHEESKTIGEGEVNFNKNPWKTDLSEGEIRSEFIASINAKHHAVVGTQIKDINLQVWHHLVVEMIVLEEYIPKGRPNQPNPTGAARILRSQFPLKITNRAGMGVAWDEETPPVYQDVPPSPPGYKLADAHLVDSVVMSPPAYARSSVIDIDITDIGAVIDDFHLGPPHELAGQSSTLGSSSTVTRRSSGASTDSAPAVRPHIRPHVRWSEDDLFAEPNLPQRAEEDEEDVDVQVEGSSRH